MIERGEHTDPSQFNEDEIDMVSRLYADGALQLAADFRFQFNSRGYLFTGANYLYMRPHFDASMGLGEIQRVAFKQKMSLIGINAGVGFRF